MVILAIETLLRDSSSLDEFINTIKTRYDVVVKEVIVAGKRMVHLKRPAKPKFFDSIQEECSNMLINEELIIVTRSVEQIYHIDDNFCLLDIPSTLTPIEAQEWFPGKLVTLSKYFNTYLITTEEDVHGRDTICNGGPTCNQIVMYCLNSANSGGIDCLFNTHWTDSMAWSFQIIQKNEFNFKSPKDYDIVLLNAINVETNHELNICQLENIAEHYHLRVPRRKRIFSQKDIQKTYNQLASTNPSIRGLIFIDEESSNETLRGKIELKTGSTWRNRLLGTASLVLNHDLAALEETDSVLDNMIELMKKHYDKLLSELSGLYVINSELRTRKQFALKVKHHPMAQVLFALADKKIDGLVQMHKIIKPIHLLSHIEQVDNEQFEFALSFYKEKICQQER